MTRAGLGLAVIIAVYAALLFADFVGQAVDQFRGHVAARTADVEADARMTRDIENAGVDFSVHAPLPVLMQVRGALL